jgi:hypothetical protein
VTTGHEHLTGLLSNLKVDNSATIGSRRDEITKSLNLEFRGLQGSTANKLMVGSYGRWTAIRGISDLDLLFMLPAHLEDEYKRAGGPSKVLKRVRDTIANRYTNTNVKVDRLVVVVEFQDFMFEVQPVFENADESFSYPDTYSDSWKTTKPRMEIAAISDEDAAANGNLRRLCKLTRAWKNKHGVALGGLLIDTLAYNFLRDSTDYMKSSAKLDQMARDFFLFLSEEEDHDWYSAVGSGQRVKLKKRFQKKAATAYDLACTAIAAETQKTAYKKWRAVFGNAVPKQSESEDRYSAKFSQTEQYVEDLYPVDIRFELLIDCTVEQNGFRPASLRQMLQNRTFLLPRKSLTFTIEATDTPPPFAVKWKVLNRGAEAERRDMIRGQIVDSTKGQQRSEVTSFAGQHEVECFLLKNGTVVARDRIEVPISNS